MNEAHISNTMNTWVFSKRKRKEKKVKKKWCKNSE